MPEEPTEGERESLLRLAFGHGIPRRSFYVALVVGTILNLINQGDVLWGDAEFDGLKLGLTYVVPYGVATYGAVALRRHFLGRR